MKPSEYNLFDHNENGGSTIYNTITGAVISLNEKYTRQYMNRCYSDNDFSENMKRGGFIVPDDIDEKEYILSLSNRLRNGNSDDYGFTIAPTMSCNFRCPYMLINCPLLLITKSFFLRKQLYLEKVKCTECMAKMVLAKHRL